MENAYLVLNVIVILAGQETIAQSHPVAKIAVATENALKISAFVILALPAWFVRTLIVQICVLIKECVRDRNAFVKKAGQEKIVRFLHVLMNVVIMESVLMDTVYVVKTGQAMIALSQLFVPMIVLLTVNV